MSNWEHQQQQRAGVGGGGAVAASGCARELQNFLVVHTIEFKLRSQLLVVVTYSWRTHVCALYVS